MTVHLILIWFEPVQLDHVKSVGGRSSQAERFQPPCTRCDSVCTTEVILIIYWDFYCAVTLINKTHVLCIPHASVCVCQLSREKATVWKTRSPGAWRSAWQDGRQWPHKLDNTEIQMYLSLSNLLFSRHKVFENQKYTEWPQRMTLTTKVSKISCVHWILNPARSPNFNLFRSTTQGCIQTLNLDRCIFIRKLGEYPSPGKKINKFINKENAILLFRK